MFLSALSSHQNQSRACFPLYIPKTWDSIETVKCFKSYNSVCSAFGKQHMMGGPVPRLALAPLYLALALRNRCRCSPLGILAIVRCSGIFPE